MAGPHILSSLEILIETGKPIVVERSPPKEMLEAIGRRGECSGSNR
jgi:hypothetical protein